MFGTPKDFYNPIWDKGGRIHNWHNHIHEEIQLIWETFTEEQRRILATCAEEDASNEEWE